MIHDQAFWVGFNNPRFPFARGGYLPALEETTCWCQVNPSVINNSSDRGKLRKESSPSQQDIDQLKGNLISLRDALKQHVNETKPANKKIVKKWK